MVQPNVLLVVLDSVRAKNVGHLGYPRDTTPRLDEFAERATTYVNARSPGIHSISSHVSFFTGLEVAEHRATTHTAHIDSGHTIWEHLADEGYRTGLFTPNAIVAESSNLSMFFETVVGPKRQELVFPEALGPAQVAGDPSYIEYLKTCFRSDSPIKGIVNGISRELGNTTGVYEPTREHAGEYIKSFQEWRDSGSGPWAACLNLMDAHYPYLSQESFTKWGNETLRELHREAMGGPLPTQYLGDRPFWELEATKSLYDDCIRQVDAYFGKLVDELNRIGELEDTFIVITSDHGEGFGEYSCLNDNVRLIDHSWGIGEEVAHVPLVVKPPGEFTEDTITEPATLTEFPNAVKDCLKGQQGSFTKRSGDVITTSYRIQHPGDELPLPADEREPYFGPWHSVCRQEQEQIVIDAVRREDQVRYFPTCGQKPTGADREHVDSVLENLSLAGITQGSDTVTSEVKQRLHELGYTA
ncbi:sulfatase-like hydrolase/transferase [Halorubrum sp. Ea1]|uniref:sulfatase-like hydrolase/transferase n=1 Tax=Halorubrum sp. Ea1 TaxID=1480718 RepID=UPI001595199B|nr:sulfatase-like hydrolase/transferase [Halorubrum sp. Ea1]